MVSRAKASFSQVTRYTDPFWYDSPDIRDHDELHGSALIKFISKYTRKVYLPNDSWLNDAWYFHWWCPAQENTPLIGELEEACL
jgi:hypothetical protein